MSVRRLTRAPGSLTETVEGRAIVVGPDGREVLTLNRTGTAVWEALADGATEAEIVDALARRFPTFDRHRLARDVRAFLAELRAAGLVEG